METPILKQIAQLLQDRREHRRRMFVFLCLAVAVGFGTVAALRLIGQAMTHKERILLCSLTLHEHTNECYDAEGKVICGYADYVVHAHNDDCYNAEGELVCLLPEVEEHEHTDECYEEQKTLECGLEESAGHEHTSECYVRQQGELLCQLLEHQHTDECYDAEGTLICTMQEHQHADECYAWDDVLICQETEGGHQHTDSCYKTVKEKICGKPEVKLHVHTEECYEKIEKEAEDGEITEDGEENYRLICGQLQVEEHIHAEEFNCFKIIEVTREDEGESEVLGDIEDDGKTDEIFTSDLNGEEDKTDEAGGSENSGESEATEGSEDSEESKDSEEAEKTDKDEELDESEEEDKDDLTDTEQEEDKKEKKVYERIMTYKGEGYIVKVAYNEDAEIPEDAELIAEQITEESDEEHYAERKAEFQQMMEGEESTMSALFKIGFYVNGEEIEPKTPVAVTVQLVDSNGLPEGAPITVIHFAKEGNEVLDGSDVEEGSTTFEISSFSEIAIGAGAKKTVVKKDGSLYISEDYEYNHDAFHITFHIEGNAAPVETKGRSGDEGEEQSAPSDNEEDNVSPDAEADDKDETSEAETKRRDEGLEFIVEPMDETSEGYTAIADYTEGLSEESELFLVEALSYSLKYQGKEVDLSECEVTAEIVPTEALINQAEAVQPAAIPEGEGEEAEGDVANSFSVVEEAKGEVSELDIMELGRETEKRSLTSSLRSNHIAVYGGMAGNPEFTVQYYAYLDTIKKEETSADLGSLNELKIIDTRDKDLPKNGEKDSTKLLNFYLESGNEDKLRPLVKNEKELTEVYSEKSYHYVTAPNLSYFNIMAENGNYSLKEIAVLEPGEDPEDQEKWTVYSDLSDLHFTNKQETKDTYGDKFILIKEGTIIRLICDVTTTSTNVNDTKFYDYDISDGKIYDSSAMTDGKPSGSEIDRGDATYHDSGSTWYMYTGKQGINGNLDNQVFGFGNSNVKTEMEKNTWAGNELNKANGRSFGDCTYELVEGLNADGTIRYADGVNAPSLFNDGDAKGKTTYDGSLNFRREGDTYTLIEATVGNQTITNLDKFNGRPNWNKTKKIWSNYFWPLDSVASAGTPGHDLMFSTSSGASKLQGFSKDGAGSMPESDDNENHNHYFGMYYTVDFDLTEDYTGPLEYLFYGDDDMWVFLNGSGTKVSEDENGNQTETPVSSNGELICDIGGVHSSVGEYVDLWDYIEKGTEGHYTLSFFYTERGASGSTCWMQFTLPSVSFKTPTQTTGTLQVDKKVTGGSSDEEFGFNIKFLDENGNQLQDDYAYSRESDDPDRKKDDLLIWNNGNFQLKAGEYIIIRYLPIGTQYEITEIGPVEYNEETETYVPKANPDKNYLASAKGEGVTNQSQDGNGDDKRVAKGTIGERTHYTVEYTNNICYELPETGGPGLIVYTIAGVLCIAVVGAGFMYRRRFRERRV